jgi:riboflavin kinase/FMN adenylyltransferase
LKVIELSKRDATAVNEQTAVALGFFDGVHTAHRTLFSTVLKEARARGVSSAVLTFSEGGSDGIKGGVKRICTEKEKLAFLSELGFDYVFMLDFASVKSMSPSQFVEEIMIDTCKSTLAVCGFDFRFGAKAAGNSETLSSLMNERGGECIVCPAFELDGEAVSSTLIKALIAEGNIERANRLLGYPFSILGEVYHGKKLGRELGSPTANITYPENIVQLKNGVYATRVFLDGEYYASVTNVGVRPTVDSQAKANLETHIINYDGDLYGREIRVEFLSFLRQEKRFSDIKELKKQILFDIEEVIKWQKSGRS